MFCKSQKKTVHTDSQSQSGQLVGVAVSSLVPKPASPHTPALRGSLVVSCLQHAAAQISARNSLVNDICCYVYGPGGLRLLLSLTSSGVFGGHLPRAACATCDVPSPTAIRDSANKPQAARRQPWLAAAAAGCVGPGPWQQQKMMQKMMPATTCSSRWTPVLSPPPALRLLRFHLLQTRRLLVAAGPSGGQ